MRLRFRSIPLCLLLVAALLAGCCGSAYVAIGSPPTYVEITNDSDEVQYIYLDEVYIGSLDPGETGLWLVSYGWHTLAAYEQLGVFVDPIFVETYFHRGHTFYWIIQLEITVSTAEKLVPPAAPPESSCDGDAPLPAEPTVEERVPEVF